MRSRKRTTLLVLFTLVTVVVTATATRDRANQEPPTPEERYAQERYRERLAFEKQSPVVEFEKPEPADPEKLAQRRNKNKRYDKFGFSGIKDSSPRVGEESFESHWDLYAEALPVSQSNLVIVGEVLSANAHISNDKSGIYSEFTVSVNEVLKNSGSGALSSGDSITVDRAGGRVMYSNGHKRLYRIAGQNMPRVGWRYVLFLAASGESTNYQIVTGYALVDGRVSPLDDARKMYGYTWMEEAKFLKVVRDAISQSAPAAK